MRRTTMTFTTTGVQDLWGFCYKWSANLNQQGFVEASLLPDWLTSIPQKEND